MVVSGGVVVAILIEPQLVQPGGDPRALDRCIFCDLDDGVVHIVV